MSLIQFDQFDFYIIHMRNSVERYINLKTEFNKLSIDIENDKRINFVDAFIPKTKDQHKFRTLGRYGVAKAHLNAIEASIKNNSEYAFIIEDDVLFLDNFISKLNILLLNLYKNREEYEILQLRKPKRLYNSHVIKDNYISGNSRFVTAECFYLTKEIREKITKNQDWFLSGRAIDVWYTENLRCIKTTENYTSQKKLSSINKNVLKYINEN